MKPNIFSIATKELHQDAFIAWLLQWADPSNKQFNLQLNHCAQAFVNKLIGLPADYEIHNVSVERQWEGIDICAEINDEYLIIIEDKTFSGEHSNQLITYRTIAEKWCQENNFMLVCIYLKTGNEPLISLKNIESKGYKIFTRTDFLSILNSFPDIQDSIFIDFKDRLSYVDGLFNSYELKLIMEWTDNDWVGFYQYLEKQIAHTSWSYVNPPSGNGFWNAGISKGRYIDDDVNEIQYSIYIQIEQGNLCFKVCTDEDEVEFDENKMGRSVLRNKLYSLIMNKAKELNFIDIQRPDKFGKGKYMTIALVYQNNWLGANDSTVHKVNVLMTLEKYVSFLNVFADSLRKQQL
jgi:hypothetical protein